jgi:hypothetical protein
VEKKAGHTQMLVFREELIPSDLSMVLYLPQEHKE